MLKLKTVLILCITSNHLNSEPYGDILKLHVECSL